MSSSEKNSRIFFSCWPVLTFYTWGEGVYVLILITSITLNYLFGLLVQRFRAATVHKFIIFFAVAANLALIGTFKYANFLVDNLNSLLVLAGFWTIHIEPVHLPIGISFFTFQGSATSLMSIEGKL